MFVTIRPPATCPQRLMACDGGRVQGQALRAGNSLGKIMKFFLLKQLQWILKVLAGATIRKYEPSVVAITGTVGKTSTKEAVYAVLKDLRSVRKSSGSFNNELGVPLTVLGDWDKVGGVFFWIKVISIGIFNLIKRVKYPEILILEYGVQKPGDMKYLLEIAKPSIAVMTAVGETPVHVEYFNSPESVAKEKFKLLDALPAIGFAITNNDDEVVSEMSEKIRAHSMKFGYSVNSDVRISGFENLSTEDRPFGISFKLGYGGAIVPVRVAGAFGKAQSYAAAAASSVGLIFGSNLVRISESLSSNYTPPKRRMNLLNGIKKSYVLDDSYNASPLSMRAAIETVKDLNAKRKIGVLGDMLELGQFSLQAHEEIGRLAGGSFDYLVTVGSISKMMVEGASKGGVIDKKNIKNFDKAEDAISFVKDLLKPGDLVLIKASRGIGLDKIVDTIKI